MGRAKPQPQPQPQPQPKRKWAPDEDGPAPLTRTKAVVVPPPPPSDKEESYTDPQSDDEHSMARKMLVGGSGAAQAMKKLDEKCDSEAAALRSDVAALRSDVAALRSAVTELQARVAELERPVACPSPDCHPVSPSPGLYGSDDDNADSGHMHPVIGRMLTNAEYRDYDKICESWKDDIEASKEWFAEQRATSESPIDSDDDKVEPPKKKARADDTEAKALALIKGYHAQSFHAQWLNEEQITEVKTKIVRVQAFLSGNKPLHDEDTEWCVLFYEQYLAFDGRATRN